MRDELKFTYSRIGYLSHVHLRDMDYHVEAWLASLPRLSSKVCLIWQLFHNFSESLLTWKFCAYTDHP